ncbi:MAG: hypothetical protein AB7N80_10635 [Bdellovibrionales bacterium]
MTADWIERGIHFVMDHNEVMVQTMLVLVVAWGAFILGTWVLGKEEPPSSGPSVTSSPSAVVETATVGSAVSATAAAEAAVQVAKLQSELTARAQEVESLKAKISSTPAAEPVDISGYVKKIKDLEGKLAEYEILEDDIADLSLYKEENAKLKSELQRLGGDAGAVAVAAPEPGPAPAAEVVDGGAEPSPEPAPDPALSAAPPAPPEDPAAAPVVEPAATVEAKPDALVEQFATAVEKGKANEPAKPGDDLLTEFAASAPDETAPVEGAAGAGDLDTDKMMAEMASLEAVQGDGSSSLEGESDMDKMAAEASKLLGS